MKRHAGGAASAADMYFRVLGPVQVLRDGDEVPLDGCKQRTVLAALLLARGRLVTDERLSMLLWGENPPKTFSAQIYTYVSRLRKYLGDGVEIVRQRPGYLLRAASAPLDYDDFVRLTRLARAAAAEGRYEDAAAQLAAAHELWQGPALTNATEFLVEADYDQLEEARIAGVELRIDTEVMRGRHAEIVSELIGLVAQFPLRERFRAQLMICLHRCDRQADALRTYFEGRDILAEELGVDPGPMLTAAYAQVLAAESSPEQQPAEWGAPANEPQSALWARPAMLPADLSDFTGFIDQSDLVRRLLSDNPTMASRRCLLTGMPGSGKTALGVHVAHQLIKEFPDGQLAVDLRAQSNAPLDAFTVLGWFLRALGAEVPPTLQERVQRYRTLLAERRILVFLDNAASDCQINNLLPAGARSAVLVTSNARLTSITADRQVEVPLLETDEALALLARLTSGRLLADDPSAATRIARSCGYLPVALRVVGARLSVRPHWSLRRMADSVAADYSLLDRLQFGSLTVRDCFQHAYQELAPACKSVVGALAIFGSKGFTARSASNVLGMCEESAEELLEVLAEHHFLTVGSSDDTTRTAYAFHHLVALFVREIRSDSGVGALTTAG